MRALNGGQAKGDPSLDRRLRALGKAVDLLDQRMARLRPATSGAGFIGAARLTSTTGTVVQASGGGRVDEGSVTYGPPVDPYAGTPAQSSAPISSWLTVFNGYQLQLADGWYTVTVVADIAWATAANAPDSVAATILGVPDGSATTIEHPCATVSTRKGIRQPVSPAVPVYGGSTYGLVWVELEFSNYTGTADVLVGLAGASQPARFMWNIVKHT